MFVVYCLLACLCSYVATHYVAGLYQRSRLRFYEATKPKVGFETHTAKPTGKPCLESLSSMVTAVPAEASSELGTLVPSEEMTASPVMTDSAHVLSPSKSPRRRVIVAMTGATGAILGIRLLETLRKHNIETHLVMSKWAEATIAYETNYKPRDVRALATKSYSASDVAAPISSGSFRVDAMIVVPCSMKTLSSIATGYGDDLISRAADVTFKEGRRLILVARETPLSGIHLENMLTATRNGAVIFPPVPAFYTHPDTVEDIVAQSVGRMLDLVGVDTGEFERWGGMKSKNAKTFVEEA